jgi:integrase
VIVVKLQRNGKHWRAAWIEHTGKRCTRGLGAIKKVPKGVATRKCRMLEEKLNGGAQIGRSPTLDWWRQEYERQRESELSEGAVTLYRDTFKHLVAHFGKEAKLDRVTRANAAEFRVYLAGQKGKGKASMTLTTVRNHMRRACTIFKAAFEQDLILFNPFDREETAAPKVEKDFEFIDAARFSTLIDGCPTQGWRTLLSLCRLAGLRRGEALRLRWRDIAWDAHTLTVEPPHGRVTTKARRRVVPIEPDLYATLLATHERSGRDPLVVNRREIRTGNIDRDVLDIIRKAGLEPWDSPFHSLRKSLTSEWQAKHPSRAVDEWLGHSAGVSEQHYRRTLPETLAKVTGQVDPEDHKANLAAMIDNMTAEEAKAMMDAMTKPNQEQKA